MISLLWALFSIGCARLSERKAVVARKGRPLTLVGPELKLGQTAPDAQLCSPDLKPVRISDFRGKILLTATLPSLDTPVCNLEAKCFNEEASKVGKDVQVITVSRDLPFALKRYSARNGIDRIKMLSDYKDGSFGESFGLYVKELGLLARAVRVSTVKGKYGTWRLYGI